jgi:hypothetical protein
MLDGLHFITFEPNRHRSMNQIHGDDQAMVAGDTHQYSFQSLKRAVSNSHALAGVKIRMWAAIDLRFQKGSNRFDLRSGNRRSLIVWSDKTYHPTDLKHAHAVLRGR